MHASPNQGTWREVNFNELLANAFNLPACIEMDANAAALGEAWLGAGAGCQNFIYLIIGTGVGCGLYLDGKIHRGWRGVAGEVGHTTIEPDGPLCNCGNYGCLEALAAGPALAGKAQAAIQQGQKTLITEIAQGQPISAEMVFQAARQQDDVGRYLIEQEADYIGTGIANLITLLNPQRVALGGGVGMGGADLLLDPIRRAVRRRCGSWVNLDPAQIVISQLGDDAGLLGAAKLVFGKST
jgi:glucokinase